MNSRIRSISVAGPGPDTGQFVVRDILRATLVPPTIVRCAYYAFVFSLPFEATDVDFGGFTLSRILGFSLVAVVAAATFLPKRRFRFDLPPKAFWCLASYSLVYVVLGLNVIANFESDAIVKEMIIQGIKSLVQLLIFFWISYSLLQYDRIARGVLLTLTASCVVVALLQAFDITGNITAQDRLAAFEWDPNKAAEVLSLGLIALIGLAFGKEKADLKLRFLFWPCSAVLAVAIVTTGSRGVNLALVGALLVFFSQGKNLKFKLKVSLIVLLAIVFLGWLSYIIEPVRERWARAYFEEDTSGRDEIFAASWEMFLEKPLIGWGPANHLFELGSRVHQRGFRDTHNLILWIFTESGLLGAVPFFSGLWLCWLGAWRARNSEGASPIAMLLMFLAAGMSISLHGDKLSWIVLAYALARGNLDVSKNSKKRITLSTDLELAPLQSEKSKRAISGAHVSRLLACNLWYRT